MAHDVLKTNAQQIEFTHFHTKFRLKTKKEKMCTTANALQGNSA